MSDTIGGASLSSDVGHNMRNAAFKCFLPFALVAWGSGCATQKEAPSGFVPVTCPPNKAVVYLYRVRRWVGSGKEIKMFASGMAAAALKGREYSPICLDPGIVTLGHEVQGGPFGSFTWVKRDLQLQVEAGQTYFVAYRFWISPFHEHPNPRMVLVDPETAKREMSVCTRKEGDLAPNKSLHSTPR